MTKQNKRLADISAVDFCRIISAKQQDVGGIGLLAIPLTDSEQARLAKILDTFDDHGTSWALEEQARSFLLVYREREQYSRVLTDDERSQLERVVAAPPAPPRPPRSPAPPPLRPAAKAPPNWRRRGWVAGSAAAVTAVVIAGFAIFGGTPATPPTGASVQDHPPAVQVAIGVSDLQSLKQNYGPFHQLTPSDQQPQTGQPALLLLEDSGYFASTAWTVAPTAAGWQEDIAGNVSNVDVKGTYVDITDSDGVPYLVGVDQPFVVSHNPGTVLRIDATGNVYEMSLAQATAVRHHLSK